MQQKLRKIVIVLAVLGFVAFLANLLVDNPYTHRAIRTALNNVVKRETNLIVDFKALKVSVVPPGVSIYGLYVATSNAPSEALVSAAHATVRISIWSLIMGKPRLGLVQASDLTVIWPPPWGFAGFLKNPAPEPQPPGPMVWPPAFDLPIDRIVLKNSKVYLEVPLNDQVPEKPKLFVMSLVGVDLDLSYESWQEADLDISVLSANVALGATSLLEETSVEADIDLAGTHITASRLTTKGERLNFDGHVVADMTVPKRRGLPPGGRLDKIDVKAEGKVLGDLSLLGSFLDLPDTRGPVNGDVSVAATIPIEGSGETVFKVTGNGQVSDAQLAGFRLYDSKTSFDIDKDAVRLPDIEVMIGAQVFGKGSGEIKLTDAIDFDFHVQPDGLHLVDLLDALGVTFDMIDTTIQSPNLRLHGRGSPLQMNVGATAQFTNVTLPTIPMTHDVFPVPPACRFDFHLLVTSAQLDFNGTQGFCYQPTAGEAPPIPVGVVEAPARSSAVSPVAFGGQVVFGKGLDLNVRSPALDVALAQYFAQIPMTGLAKADTRIVGPFDRVVIQNRVDATNVTVVGMPLGRVAGGVNVEDGNLVWHELAVSPDEGGSIEVHSGGLTLDDPMILTARVIARDIQKGSVQRMIKGAAPDLNLSFGVQSLEADIKGPLLAPLAMAGRIKVTANNLELGSDRFADSITGTLTSSDKGWSTDDLTASLGDLAVNAKLTHTRARPFDYATASTAEDLLTRLGASPDDAVDAEVSTIGPSGDSKKNGELRPDQLGTLPYVGAKLKDIGLEGRIVMRGKVSGKAGNLEGTFQGSVERPTIFGSVLSPINVRGFLDDGKLDLMFDHSGSSFEGRLSLDLAKDGVPYEWFFNFNRMDLRALGTAFFHGDPRNYIYLTADWRMRGTFGDWWRSTGELEIKDLRGQYVQDIASQTKTMPIKQESPVTLLFTKDGWHFKDDKDLYLSGRNLQLRLSMLDNRPPEKLGIKIESIVDMAIAKEFSQSIDTATGKLRVTCEITGPVADPNFVVEVTDLKNTPFIAATWSAVSLGLADLRPPLRNIRLRVLYKDGRLMIDQFSADKGSGNLSASGALNLSNISDEQESRLDLLLNDATMIYPVAFLKSFETQISGNVSIAGRGVPYKVSGDLVINKARSTKEVDIRDEIINALRQKSFSTTIVKEKPTVVFDLNVHADQSINIHNRNLQSVLSTDLAIRGTDIEPVVSGQVEIDKGKFTYKRDFSITRGIVTFDDPVKPDPSLDILAEAEVDAYRVYIGITGRASNPTVEFSVDPPTRESGAPISKLEILVLLSRGKLPEENRSIGQETEKAAASEAANLILGQFEEPVEKLFDLSGQNVVRNVYIDMHPSPEGDPVPRLNLPLDLGEDFDIVFRADQTSNEMSGEYSVHDNIKFSGVVERRRDDSAPTEATSKVEGADAKVNLKFRFSFE